MMALTGGERKKHAKKDSGLRAAGDAPTDVPSRAEGIVNIRLPQSSAFYRYSATLSACSLC